MKKFLKEDDGKDNKDLTNEELNKFLKEKETRSIKLKDQVLYEKGSKLD